MQDIEEQFIDMLITLNVNSRRWIPKFYLFVYYQGQGKELAVFHREEAPEDREYYRLG